MAKSLHFLKPPLMWPLPLIHARIERSKLTLGIDERAWFFSKGPDSPVKTGHISSQGNWHITSPLLCNKWTSLSLSSVECWSRSGIEPVLQKKRALNFTTTLLGYCILAHFFYERLSSREHHFLRRAGSAFSRFVILTRTTWFPSFDINSLPGGLTMRCATCTNAFPMMRVETMVQNTNDDDHGIKKRRLWLHFRCIFSALVKVLHVQLQFLWYLVM